MKDLLDYFLRHIVDNPDKIAISETTDAPATSIYKLTVDQNDMGKVIGRGGRIIKAIRDLARILAVKQNSRINIVLTED